MNANKKPFAQRAEQFFAGKGFYIVLFLCVTVIGVSAWSMLTGDRTSGAADIEPGVAAVNLEPAATLPPQAPAATAAPKPTAAPAPESTAAPAPEAKTPAATPAPTAEAKAPAAAPDYCIWPVAGPVENAYSIEVLVFNDTMQDWRTHDGIDIACELGTQVKAMTAGTVTDVYRDDLYGTTVVIAHKGGLVSQYSNLAAAPTVAAGDRIAMGQVIGAVGDTALCEAGEVCHLHFALTKDGMSVDPMDYLPG